MALKLTYFNVRGVAEPIRWILSHGGIEFEDIRTPFTEPPPVLPPEVKAKCRWGQVPLAEFEGKNLTQSLAVTRYFARKAKLVPEDPYLAAICDEYVDAIKDLMAAMAPLYHMSDSEEKKKKLEEITNTIKPKYLTVFESILEKNGGKYLVGIELTWADIYLAFYFDHFEIILGVDFSDGYANLKSLKAMVVNQPKIIAFIEQRPKTKF